MRRRLLWLAIAVPALLYLAFFAGEGLAALGWRTAGLERTQTVVSQAIPILAALALGLGVINLCSVNGANIARRRKGWPYSVIVFVSFGAIGGALAWQFARIDPEQSALQQATDDAWKRLGEAQRIADVAERNRALAALTADDWAAIRRRQAWEDEYRFDPRRFCYQYINIPLASTVMALLGFYITYAAYRAFRIRSTEATVMMASAAVVILGSDPVGGWVSQGTLTMAADFDNTVLNSGMQRGLWLGIHVATIVVCLRMFLGYERGVIDAAPSEE